MARSPQRDAPPDQSRPLGSSIALSLAIVGFVLVILVLGSLFILQQIDGDDDNGASVIPSPSGTSELVLDVPTATEPGSTAEASPTTGATTPDTTLSPSPTGTESTPTEDATATEPPDDEPTATEPEPPPTEPDPTATDEIIPTETPLPLEGEFGFLPPAQLPSGGVSTTLDLDYQIALSLESLPTVGTVYRIIWPLYTLEDVEFARDRLALQAPVIEEGVGVYRVESDRGTLFVSPTEIVFRAAGFGDGSGLPDDGSAIAIAREWVDLSSFVGSEMDSGAVVARDEDQQRVVVKFRPVAPQPNLAPNPSATVTIGPGGTVLEVRISWPADLEASDYGYSAAIDVWQAVQNGQGFLEADISSILATGSLSGTATISDYSTAYTLAGNPTVEQYLVPLITFHGTARIDQTGDEIPISVSIPVVYFEEGTAG